MTKVCLYIATHNITKLKYFGKTTKYFTKESLQLYYHGSGKYWKRHLNKHSDDVTMEVYGIFDISEVEQIALDYSLKHNIVESKEYANLIPENGLQGGLGMQTQEAIDNFKKSRYSKESLEKNARSRIKAEQKRQKTISTPEFKRKNKSSIIKGTNKSIITKSSMAFKDRVSGKNHYSTKTILIYDNTNTLVFSIQNSFKEFCLKHSLPVEAFRRSYRNNTSLYLTKRAKNIAIKNGYSRFIGWKARYK